MNAKLKLPTISDLKQVVNQLFIKEDNSFNQITLPSGNTFKLVGNNINSCGNIRIGLNTMYKIHKTNKMAFAYSKKISQMVARNGLKELDSQGQVVENSIVVEDMYKYIGGKSNLSLFVSDFFDQAFCSGQVFGIPNKVNGLGIIRPDGQFKILDTRGIEIVTDKYGIVEKYIYKTSSGSETFTTDGIVDYIVYRDVDIKYKGISLYNSIVMNALTNNEARRTQMYYFANDARPNMFVMLNPDAFKGPDGRERKAEFDRQRQQKYGGATGAGKMHSSHLITDIKTLDISNVDLDLINLTRENDNAFSAVFLLDSRLIGLQKDTGSFGEVESTTIRQGNDQITSYGELFSDFVTQLYIKFVNPAFEGIIAPINGVFKDINKDKEIGLKETAGGVISINEYRTKFDYEPLEGDEYDKPIQNKAPTTNTTTE